MQTFLPYLDFHQSASCLDRQRLGKQRVEGLQILNALLFGGGWQNHPAVKMWKGYEHSLSLYVESICREWIFRGYKDSILTKILNMREDLKNKDSPWWLGNPLLHSSHKSNLLRKNPHHYGNFGWSENPFLPYWWPER